MSSYEVDCACCYKAIVGQAEGIIGGDIDDGWINVNDVAETWFHTDCMRKIFNVYEKHKENTLTKKVNNKLNKIEKIWRKQMTKKKTLWMDTVWNFPNESENK